MGIMRPEIPESALRGQVHFGFWPSGCPSGVQVNLHFATRSKYLAGALVELLQIEKIPSGADRILHHAPEAFNGVEVMPTGGR
jgi:hypothetical protein